MFICVKRVSPSKIIFSFTKRKKTSETRRNYYYKYVVSFVLGIIFIDLLNPNEVPLKMFRKEGRNLIITITIKKTNCKTEEVLLSKNSKIICN